MICFEELKKDYYEVFGKKDVANDGLILFRSPGRINLIGEHIDYNGGYVMPAAIDRGAGAIVCKREDGILSFTSTFDKSLVVTIPCDSLEYNEEHDWANYAKGVIAIYKERGYLPQKFGFNIIIGSDLPVASGLSSSACIEVLISVVLNDIYNCGISGKERALISRECENNYIGVNCGIMDQFIIANGEWNKAMLLDCDTLDYSTSPVFPEDEGFKVMVCNTKKPRQLVTSAYNERRAECEEAVRIISTVKEIKYLCELTPDDFDGVKHLLSGNILDRATHAVMENARTIQASELLKKGDIIGFGKLLNQSHESLRDLFLVSCVELDTLVEEAIKIDGVYGARMTGAGFGGCAIAVIKEYAVEEFIEKVGKRYKEVTGYEAEFYLVSIESGASRL